MAGLLKRPDLSPLHLGRRDTFAGALASVGAAVLARPGPALGQDSVPQPSSPPILLPDTMMHVGAVRAVAVTVSGSMIATGGVDRSVRLWDGTTRRLLRRWHPPLGDGEIGVVDALDFSHDGRWLFVAAVDWIEPPRCVVYVIEVDTGKIRRIVANRSGPAWRCQQLAASPAGGHFALAGSDRGVIVFGYNTDLSVRPQHVDQPNRGDPTQSVAFSNDGATMGSVSLKGLLRLFSIGAQVVEKPPPLRSALSGEPLSLAFSADSRRVAVGFANRREVAVVDLQGGQVAMLEPPASIGPGSLGPGNLGIVAWGAGDDGFEWLFAGGTIQQPGAGNLVFAWRDGLNTPPLSIEAAQDSIAAMARHPSGGVVCGSSDAAWARIVTGRRGRRLDVAATPAERLDFRDTAKRRWGVDRSGYVVEFQGIQPGQPALRFDMASLILDEFPARIPRPDLRRPRASGQVRLPPGILRRGENLRSSDTGLQGDRTLAGTDEMLLLLDSAGREIGRKTVATPAWAVLISGDGRVAVVAHGDGTLRWYGLAKDNPLHELGGVFVHADRRKWLAWRNDGHFAYSEFGGQTLVGVHENGRYDPADPTVLTSRWSSIDEQFRRLYDPTAIRLLLEPGPHWELGRRSPTQGLGIARDAVPTISVVDICASDDLQEPARRSQMLEALEGQQQGASPPGASCQDLQRDLPAGGGDAVALSDGANALRVRLDLGAAASQVTVDVFVNGVNAGRTFHAAGTRIEKIVPLHSNDATVEFRAYGSQGVFTRAMPVVVTRGGTPTPVSAPARAVTASKLHVLAIGIDRYAGNVTPLNFAVADARTFSQTIEKVLPRFYTTLAPPVVLTNDSATVTSVVEALLGLAQAGPEDAVMIYIAGHGVSVGGNYSFIPANVRDINTALRRSECLDANALIGLLSNIRAARSLLLLDTCFANAIDLQVGGRLGHESGRFVLTASSSTEAALDGYNGRNGVFGHAVKEALTEFVPASGGVLDVLELGLYVRRRVTALAEKLGSKQTAHFQVAGEAVEFPVAQVR